MDAVKFTRAAMRMCNDYYSKCWSCPAGDNTSCKLDSSYSAISAEEKVAIVEQWAAEHPAKTRQSVFLEQFPNAPIYTNTHNVALKPCLVDTTLRGHCPTGRGCDICHREFWLAEVEDT